MAKTRRIRLVRGPKTTAFPYLVVYPAFTYVLIFLIFPILYLLFLSLSSTDQFSKVSIFKGFDNYQFLLQDKLFWKSLSQTIKFALIRLVAIVPLSLLIALGVNQTKRMRAFYTMAFFSPVITSTAAVALIWMWVYDPSIGLANYLGSLIGLPKQSFLLNTDLALYSIALLSIWKDVGWYMVIFLAGLQGIPEVFYEAAKIDGAGLWARFRHITLPLLGPTTLLIMVVATIASLREFTSIFIMTRSTISGEPGGPVNSTLTLVVYMFKNAFLYNKYGLGASIAIILLIGIALMTAIQFRLFRVEWEY
jgi:ABC-type sugar transport system permease subunit